jgi:hypothetical protein
LLLLVMAMTIVLIVIVIIIAVIVVVVDTFFVPSLSGFLAQSRSALARHQRPLLRDSALAVTPGGDATVSRAARLVVALRPERQVEPAQPC